MNSKIISALLSMAFVAVAVYLGALFHTKPLHAASIFIFPGVAIEDGSLKPLALNIDAVIVATSSEFISEGIISSSTDLDTFTRDLAEEDDNLYNVVVKEESVAVSYLEPVKFLGIIPTEIVVTVEADENGQVSIRYPWYAFLAGKNAGELKPGLQLRVGDILQSATSTNATSTEKLSPQVRAGLIKAIHTALKEYRANATTTVKVK